tara:strand:- start:55 stop:963 length:909 start_codon:yes stop_codon:yes gene_type:complete
MEFNKIITADSLEHLKTLDENVFDSCVTDPPYHLQSIVKRFTKGPAAKHGKDGSFNRLSKGFMGQEWDGGDIAFQKELWEQVYRTMKPGAVLLAFSATRNYHRMAVAVEDAEFEIFDMINWVYGTGFPKRKNLLKPAHEPILMARKGVNKNLNIDDCRIDLVEGDDKRLGGKGTFKTDKMAKNDYGKFAGKDIRSSELGRYPANVIHDGLNEDWAKYFYCAKASKKEKEGTDHPTVKPLELMKYLVRLVTPKDGLVLDPFAGTGTTGEAAILEDRKYYLIEKTEKYIPVINKRLNKHNKFFI